MLQYYMPELILLHARFEFRKADHWMVRGLEPVTGHIKVSVTGFPFSSTLNTNWSSGCWEKAGGSPVCIQNVLVLNCT